jgi:hypothetical protein
MPARRCRALRRPPAIDRRPPPWPGAFPRLLPCVKIAVRARGSVFAPLSNWSISNMTEVVIVGGLRTGIGRFGGSSVALAVER